MSTLLFIGGLIIIPFVTLAVFCAGCFALNFILVAICNRRAAG